jgi:hypothetical protein
MEELNKSLRYFAFHSFSLTSQMTFNRNLIGSLRERECVIHIDFAESYQGKRHAEMQSFHFGGSHPQITIHHRMYYTHVNYNSPQNVLYTCK